MPREGDGERRLVLFVCYANVCRSPLAHFLVESRVVTADQSGPPWRFASAGTHAVGGEPVCRATARVLREQAGGSDFARRHRSRRVTGELVAEAMLVLVASREEQAAVARAAPDARPRLFTLLEAARLAEAASQEGQPVARWQVLREAGFGRPVRGRGPRRDAGPQARVDVEDAHAGAAPHRRVHDDVRWSVSRLAEGLRQPDG